MTEPLTLVHDPDYGCVGCPFLMGEDTYCSALSASLELPGAFLDPVQPAGCPLRSGDVLVSRDEAEKGETDAG